MSIRQKCQAVFMLNGNQSVKMAGKMVTSAALGPIYHWAYHSIVVVRATRSSGPILSFTMMSFYELAYVICPLQPACRRGQSRGYNG